MIIGSHVHFGKEQFLGSVKEAVSYDANALMLYTGAPQNTYRSNIDLELYKRALKLMEEKNIQIDHVICHAPYIINLANKAKEEAWNFSINFLKNELKRCETLKIKYIVLHPGSAVTHSKEEGINNIIEALNLLNLNESQSMILLETMAGKGSECGSTLEEIKTILKGVNSSNIGVCLDTCHLNDAGYDMDKFDEFLDLFDSIIGIEKIKCIHINDSKNPLNSHKDRHANIGYGTIGYASLLKIVNNEKIKDVPKILETPYISKDDNEKELIYPPYKFEIAMLRKGEFNSHLIDDIRSFYK